MSHLSVPSVAVPKCDPLQSVVGPDSSAEDAASVDIAVPAGIVAHDDPFVHTHSSLALHHSNLRDFLMDWFSKHESLINRMHDDHNNVLDLASLPQPQLEHGTLESSTRCVSGTSGPSIGKFHTLRTTLNMANVKDDLEHHVRKIKEVSERPPPKSMRLVSWCMLVEDNAYFQHFCSLVILANAVCLTITTQQSVKDLDGNGGNQRRVFRGFEVAFCCFYTGELVIRLAARGLKFFSGPEMNWNLFDLVLVATALQEQIAAALSVTEGQNLSYLRIVRLLKMLKVLRMVRLMRAFRELRLVLDSILGSMKAMLWSVALIVGISFMFGVCFVQAITELLSKDGKSCPATGESQTHHLACQYWGSVTESMLSLYKASTGGCDWAELAEPLHAAGIHYYAIFCFYIGFFLFVVMNSLTSLFLDSIMMQAQKDEETLLQEQLARKQQYMKNIVKIYTLMDKDNTGDVSYEEFMQHADDKCMAAFASSLEIEPAALEQFFSILSAKGKRTVDLENFVVGCIKLRGLAKSMDVMDCIVNQKQLQEDLARFVAYCKESFHDLQLCMEQQITSRSTSCGASRSTSCGAGAAEAVAEVEAAAATAPAQSRLTL